MNEVPMEEANREVGGCESCVFYDYDEITDAYYCTVNADQDDWGEVQRFGARRCPYYRFYDEYKSVQKQI